MIHSGIDLVSRARIKKIFDEVSTKFLEKICTAKEIEYLKTQKRFDEKLAGIFALKEAFSKAVGTGFGDRLAFKEVEVHYTPRGQPRLTYLGKKFSPQCDSWDISCSVSHEGDMVAAVGTLSGEVP